MPTHDQSAHSDALDFLFGRIDYERALTIHYDETAFRLSRMRALLERLGNPQQRVPIVHIAGTKGKGSTSAMIAAMLSAAGYRTGLYTSPHLDRVEERIAVDGRPCSSQDLVGLIERVRRIVEEMDDEAGREDPAGQGPTYFEILTAMAFCHFAAVETDIAVVEVGLGGRLDSTTVCRPVVSVVTSISLDHTHQLGDTLAAIAREKAGIIKPGIPVISGVCEPEPQDVISQVAVQHDAPLVQLGRDFHFDYYAPKRLDRPVPGCAPGMLDFRYDYGGRSEFLEGVQIGLLGKHQGANAAVALAVAEELKSQGWRLPELASRRGLAEVRWPARIEVVSRQPTVVVDAAHNVASTECLVETLVESFQARRRLLVFATSQDKDARGMLRALLPRFEEVIITRYQNNPRGADVEELERLVEQLGPVRCFVRDDPCAAWGLARQHAGPEDLICISGSFFLAAEMRGEIARRPASVEQSLAERA